MREILGWQGLDDEPEAASAERVAPGKVSLTAQLVSRRARPSAEPHPLASPLASPVQMLAPGARADDPFAVHEAAARGVTGSPQALPYQEAIQRSFGHHDVSGVRAHVGGAATEAAAAIGASAYATGDDVAFAAPPDLRQAAHETAHVVQQRGGVRLDGGVGRSGDVYEQHADQVADKVVRGESAEALLDTMAHRGAAGGAVAQRDDRDHDGVDDALIESTEAPEDLDVLLAALRSTNVTELGATTAALTPAARGHTRAKLTYQFPLDHRARRARGAHLQQIAEEANRLAHMSTVEVEMRQDWGRYALSGDPLVATDDLDGRIAAVRANAELGFTTTLIQALWRRVVPDESRRSSLFTRVFTDALRDRGFASDGVLTEAAVRAIDVAQAITAPRHVDQHYERAQPWAGFSNEEFARARDAVCARLGVAATTLARVVEPAEPEPAPGPRGRGGGRRAHRARRPEVTLDPAFVHAVMNWQAWHHRGDAHVHWGRLDAEDLAELGVPPPAGAPAEDAAAAATATATATADAAPPPVDTAAIDPTAITDAQRASMTELRRGIEELRDAMRTEAQAAARAARAARPARGRGRGRAAAEPPPAPYVPPSPSGSERLTTYLHDTALPRMSAAHLHAWSPSQMVRRGSESVTAWANRVDDALAELLGEAPAHDADAAAAQELERLGVLTGRGALHRVGWDPRLHRHETDADGTEHTVSPEERSPEVLHQLQRYRDRLQGLLDGVQQGLNTGAADDLRRALGAIAAARTGGQLAPPELIRHRWRTGWPPTPATDGSVGDLRSRAQRWRSALRTVLGTTSTEIGLTPAYGETIVNHNPDAVFVDLNRAGVELTNNHGNLLPQSDMHLDPEFALRMTSFLQWLAGMGVTRMWTSGFLRNAMSPQDTHPMGLACDITGFKIGEHVLHLRSGVTSRDGYEAAQPSPPAGGSAWFDHHNRIGDRTYAQIMMGIAWQMTAHFDRIVGPGHNPEHMNHFHVEKSPGGAAGNRPHLMAMSSASTHLAGTARDAVDARDEHWDDGVVPLPLLDERGPLAAGGAGGGADAAVDDDGGGVD